MKILKNEKVIALFSIGALFGMMFSVSIFGLLVNPIICFLLYLYINNKKTKNSANRKTTFILALLFELLLIYGFFTRWSNSPTVIEIASRIKIPAVVITTLTAIVLSVLSFYAIYCACEYIVERMAASTIDSDKLDYRWVMLICFISALITITICSRSSFIYPYNDWYDANCFFTVGKGMMNGLVPYKDLLEQKGPFIYVLHGIAWLISHESFFGVYLIELACQTIFLYYSYRIVELYSRNNAVYLIPVLSVICCTSYAFYYGDSAEELCLPFLSASLYLFVKAIVEDKDLTIKQSVLIGVLSGCVFWAKFSLIGMYLGWYIVTAFCMVNEKKVSHLLKTTMYIGLGVCISSLPYLVYFGINGAIKDWLEVYFYNNLFLYTENTGNSSGILKNVYTGIYNVLENNQAVFYLLLMGLIYKMFSKENKENVYLLSMLSGMFLLVYVGGRHYFYYSIILNVFSVYGLLFLKTVVLDALNNRIKYSCVKVTIIIMCISAIASYFLTINRYMIGRDKNELPQYQFAQIIKQSNNPTILNYGFLDGGFYTTSNVLPNCRYFCKLNVQFQQMYDMQEYYLNNGLCEFVVSRKEITCDKYELIATSQSIENSFSNTLYYYLYKLK